VLYTLIKSEKLKLKENLKLSQIECTIQVGEQENPRECNV